MFEVEGFCHDCGAETGWSKVMEHYYKLCPGCWRAASQVPCRHCGLLNQWVSKLGNYDGYCRACQEEN